MFSGCTGRWRQKIQSSLDVFIAAPSQVLIQLQRELVSLWLFFKEITKHFLCCLDITSQAGKTHSHLDSCDSKSGGLTTHMWPQTPWRYERVSRTEEAVHMMNNNIFRSIKRLRLEIQWDLPTQVQTLVRVIKVWIWGFNRVVTKLRWVSGMLIWYSSCQKIHYSELVLILLEYDWWTVMWYKTELIGQTSLTPACMFPTRSLQRYTG